MEAADIRRRETVLEIGAGLGILTAALLKTGANVIAVEKDRTLIPFLEKRFGDQKKLTLIHGDALELDLRPPTPAYKVVANLPYAVSTAILRKLTELQPPPDRMVLMLQREVGERLAAAPG